MESLPEEFCSGDFFTHLVKMEEGGECGLERVLLQGLRPVTLTPHFQPPDANNNSAFSLPLEGEPLDGDGVIGMDEVDDGRKSFLDQMLFSPSLSIGGPGDNWEGITHGPTLLSHLPMDWLSHDPPPSLTPPTALGGSFFLQYQRHEKIIDSDLAYEEGKYAQAVAEVSSNRITSTIQLNQTKASLPELNGQGHTDASILLRSALEGTKAAPNPNRRRSESYQLKLQDDTPLPHIQNLGLTGHDPETHQLHSTTKKAVQLNPCHRSDGIGRRRKKLNAYYVGGPLESPVIGMESQKERCLHHCHICRKPFKDKYSLTVHIRTHTGEKPFPCSLCAKNFRQKAHLAKHYQTHTAKVKDSTNENSGRD